MYKQAEAFPLLDKDEVEGVLSGAFYSPAPEGRSVGAYGPPAGPRERARAKPLTKPEHYKVICISMYKDDLAQLDAMVKELKARGLTKANRSALIRQALLQLDLDKVPRGI